MIEEVELEYLNRAHERGIDQGDAGCKGDLMREARGSSRDRSAVVRIARPYITVHFPYCTVTVQTVHAEVSCYPAVIPKKGKRLQKKQVDKCIFKYVFRSSNKPNLKKG